MVNQTEIKAILGRLQDEAPSGYALAFHIKFTTPTYLFQTYPADWLEYYSQNGLVMQDPTVSWGFENVGSKPWSEMKSDDTSGVLVKAAEYGMKYGIAYATEIGGKRSLGSFSRGDREFTDAERQSLSEAMDELHRMLDEIEELSPEIAAELRRMSVIVTRS